MLGSFTVLPAVEYFCLYAGTAILFDFILQVLYRGVLKRWRFFFPLCGFKAFFFVTGRRIRAFARVNRNQERDAYNTTIMCRPRH